jgi:hypothetical protein
MARNSNDKWTHEEDERLLKLRSEGKSNFLIAAALRRSVISIHARIYVLNKRTAGRAKMQPLATTRPRWTTEDEKRLLEMKSSGASVPEIAVAAQRTEAAIENRLHVLKYRSATAQRE